MWSLAKSFNLLEESLEQDLDNNESIIEEVQIGGSTDLENDENGEEYDEEQLPINTFQNIVYYTNQFSVNNLIDMIKAKDLDLGDTDFFNKNEIELNMFEGDIKYQRNFVWEPRVQTKFIESVISNLPIPNLIFYTKRNKTSYNVIDGKQRLTTLYLFIEGKIGINKKYLNINITSLLKEPSSSEEDYVQFIQLKDELQKRLKYYRLYVTTIDLDSSLNEDIKTRLEYEIFDRLNTGSVTLSLQEIRNNIISDSYLQKKLKELSNLPSFQNIYYTHKDGTEMFNVPGNYTKKKRMYDQELVLRTMFYLHKVTLNKDYLIAEKDSIFAGLTALDNLSNDINVKKTFNISKYSSMRKNLNQVAEDLKNESKNSKIDEYVNIIKKTLDQLNESGGNDICRKGGNASAFNVSLFESIFIPLLYCNYYNINIGDNLQLNEIKNSILNDPNFKTIVDKGGSTQKDYVLYKLLLGLKYFIGQPNKENEG